MKAHAEVSKGSATFSQTKVALYNLSRTLTSVHVPGQRPDVFLFATPRGGSTWLMELILSQPGFKAVDEPLNIRKPLVQHYLPLDSWEALQDPQNLPVLHDYFARFASGKLRICERPPWKNKFYRVRTDRIVYKVLHGGENRINWFRETFAGRIVFLLRHPIAVSLSRSYFPRLESFLRSSAYRDYFKPSQLAFAEAVAVHGSKLEKGVLDWCFQNAIPLRDVTDEWAVVTYEQLTLEPEPVIDYLVNKLSLPNKAAMMGNLDRPSFTTGKSNQQTQQQLNSPRSESAKQFLVGKWQGQVSPTDVDKAREILDVFEIGAYSASDVLPAQRLWISTEAIQEAVATP